MLKPSTNHMPQTLMPHPQTPSRSIKKIDATLVVSDAGAFHVAFAVTGGLHNLTIPAAAQHERKDQLWLSTCFEIFLKDVRTGTYWEINLSPSSEWAAYRFASYRSDRQNEENILISGITCNQGPNTLQLDATFAITAASSTPLDSLKIGLSAVIEETGKHKSYWALAHPSGKPDFHSDACFTLAPSEAEAT